MSVLISATSSIFKNSAVPPQPAQEEEKEEEEGRMAGEEDYLQTPFCVVKIGLCIRQLWQWNTFIANVCWSC
jgi:hypothetical protein